MRAADINDQDFHREFFAIVHRSGPKRNGFFSRLADESFGKFLEHVRKLFRVKIGDGLRELEQLIERGLHRLVVFQLRQRGDEAVERKH